MFVLFLSIIPSFSKEATMLLKALGGSIILDICFVFFFNKKKVTKKGFMTETSED